MAHHRCSVCAPDTSSLRGRELPRSFTESGIWLRGPFLHVTGGGYSAGRFPACSKYTCWYMERLTNPIKKWLSAQLARKQRADTINMGWGSEGQRLLWALSVALCWLQCSPLGAHSAWPSPPSLPSSPGWAFLPAAVLPSMSPCPREKSQGGLRRGEAKPEVGFS